MSEIPLGLERGMETSFLHSKFWEMWAKEVLWNCFKDRDEVGGQVPQARWGVFLGKRGGLHVNVHCLNWVDLDFFS